MPPCKTCTKSATNCTSCFPFARLQPQPKLQTSTCEIRCEKDMEFVDSNGNCQKCHPSCLQCIGPNEYQCIKCDQFSFYQAGSCLKDCPKGWYGHIGTNTCLRCHSDCDTCDGPDKNSCITCAEGRVMNEEEEVCSFQLGGLRPKSLIMGALRISLFITAIKLIVN